MAETRQTFDLVTTTVNAMTDIHFLPIAGERLAAMREHGMDEHGNPWTLRSAEGWEPLRCCLRRASPGEEIALISYSPWTRPNPPAFQDSPSMLNPFDHTGARVYEHITFVDPGDDHEAAVRAVMSQPEVAFLHVRSSVAGCLTFEVQPVGR
jgi:hypothetical protein